MALSAVHIAEVLREIAPAVQGGTVQKIFQPGPFTILWEIRQPGANLRLLLSADPDSSRVHLAIVRHQNPATPPVFCQLLRAHLEGCRIAAVEQLQGDRIVRLALHSATENCTVVAELTGRSANILLLTGEDKILGALKTDRVKVGQLYTPPLPGAWISGDRGAGPLPSFPISEAMEREYQLRESEREQRRLLQARTTALRKTVKRTARRVEGLTSDLQKAARYRDYARYGELLKAGLSEIHKGQDSVTVVDYFDPALPTMVLPLDPAKDAHGNMDDYFKKHRKHLAAEREIQPRIMAAEAELRRLQAELASLQQAEAVPNNSRHVPAPPRASHVPPSAPVRRGGTRRRAESGKGKRPFRRFISADGLPIFVGRNAAENEELTFGLARGHDVWFHAQGTPGSHVVLRIEKGQQPPIESIQDAATLALLYSDLKKSGKGDVIYTTRTAVRKVKSKTPGTVSVTQEKSVFIRLDPHRLRRLKESGSVAQSSA